MKSESKIRVIRNNREVELSSTELVPGDFVLFPVNGGYTVECDAVLVDGSCVVNESMLTGESIPVTKVAIPDENVKFNYDHQRQYILFQGTQVFIFSLAPLFLRTLFAGYAGKSSTRQFLQGCGYQNRFHDNQRRISQSHLVSTSSGSGFL